MAACKGKRKTIKGRFTADGKAVSFVSRAHCGGKKQYQHPSAAQKGVRARFKSVVKLCHREAPFARKKGAARDHAFKTFKSCLRQTFHSRF